MLSTVPESLSSSRKKHPHEAERSKVPECRTVYRGSAKSMHRAALLLDGEDVASPGLHSSRRRAIAATENAISPLLHARARHDARIVVRTPRRILATIVAELFHRLCAVHAAECELAMHHLDNRIDDLDPTVRADTRRAASCAPRPRVGRRYLT
jgi:hypothetical protein